MPKRKPSAHFAKQAQEVYDLSNHGLSYRQIAEEMGVSLATVQRRMELYIKDRVHPKADEFRARQIDSLHMYLRALRKPIESGDPKAIANAVRIQERIAKLLGLDSATAFKVEIEKTDDTIEVHKIMDHFFSTNPKAEPKVIPHVDVTQRKKRPIKETPAITYAAPLSDEFAKDSTFAPHEIQTEDVRISEDLEEFELPPRPRRRAAPFNPLLVDNDD